MLDQAIIDSLIQSASEMLARSGDGDNHTVAASINADDGKFYSGMNLYHFTGGPCAEIVALARLVSEGGGAKPLAIVAVADRGRGVIAPCGRCRQDRGRHPRGAADSTAAVPLPAGAPA